MVLVFFLSVELIAGLATDLQQEFYPHLAQFTAVFMTTTLRIQDAGTVKWTLRCLGHLLKILWRPVSANMTEVYSSLAPVMDQKNPDHIRYLGAETLSFLLRKTKTKRELCQLILTSVTDYTDKTAVAKLLLESVKTVNGQFNIGLDKAWPVFLDLLSTAGWGSILEDLYRFAAEHTTVEFVGPIVDITLEKILHAEEESAREVLLTCLSQLFVIKKGKLVQSPAKFVLLFEQLISRGSCSSCLLRCMEHFLQADRMARSRDDFSHLVDLVLDSGFDLENKLSFVSLFLADTAEGVLDSWLVLRPYLALVQREHSGPVGGRVFAHLADVLQARNPPCRRGAELTASEDAPAVVDLQLVPVLRKIPTGSLFPSFALAALSTAEHGTTTTGTTTEQLSHYLTVASTVKPLPDKNAAGRVVSALIQHIVSDKETVRVSDKETDIVSVLPQAIHALVRLAGSPQAAADSLPVDRLVRLFLSQPPGSLPCLQALNFALACGGPSVVDHAAVLARLVALLGCPDRLMRELALHSLSLLLPALGPGYTQQPNDTTPSFLGKLFLFITGTF